MYKTILRNTVVKLSPYPLEFVSYSAWRRTGRRRRKRRNPKKCQGCFLRAGAFSLGRTVSTHLCRVPNIYSPVLFADASLCRTLVGVIHCITVYKPPPSLHRQHYCAVCYSMAKPALTPRGQEQAKWLTAALVTIRHDFCNFAKRLFNEKTRFNAILCSAEAIYRLSSSDIDTTTVTLRCMR